MDANETEEIELNGDTHIGPFPFKPGDRQTNPRTAQSTIRSPTVGTGNACSWRAPPATRQIAQR